MGRRACEIPPPFQAEVPSSGVEWRIFTLPPACNGVATSSSPFQKGAVSDAAGVGREKAAKPQKRDGLPKESGRISPPCMIPGRSGFCAPTGQPKTAQGEALRFDVREMDPSPERAQQPGQPRPGSPTGDLCRPFRAAARLCHQSTGRCPGLSQVSPLGLRGPVCQRPPNAQSSSHPSRLRVRHFHQNHHQIGKPVRDPAVAPVTTPLRIPPPTPPPRPASPTVATLPRLPRLPIGNGPTRTQPQTVPARSLQSSPAKG